MKIKQSVLMFRKRLLAYSETFIADYGAHLQRYAASYAGYGLDKRGLSYLDRSEAILLSDYSRFPSLEKTLYKYGLACNKEWLNAIRRKKPDLLHAHFGFDGVAAINLAKKLNIPLITTFYGHDIAPDNLRSGYKKSLPRLYEKCTLFIAFSAHLKRRALAHGCPESKIIVHYSGLDLGKFTGEKEYTANPSILFVGRLQYKKGVKYAIRAMKIVAEKHPSAKLLIAGSGPLQKDLELLSQDIGTKVQFLGVQTPAQVSELMRKAWIFCAPSITDKNGDAEGLGMVFLEAQAMRLPIVSFKTGGIPEAVDDGKTGLLCDQKDVQKLAQNILFFLDNEEKRKEFGAAGRKYIERNFDVKKQTSRLETIYDDVINQYENKP